ncbi:MAG: nuclear transport factor 2 family protein [Pyrinomonadaceae bacterium]
MKPFLFLFALILTMSLTVLGQGKKSERDLKVEQELRNLVRSWDEAYVKGDTTTLGRLLADEFTFVGGPKKSDYLASFKTSQLVIMSAVSSDIEVQVYGDSAVLTGVDTIIAKNKDQTLFTKWLYLDVWIKRDGRWQCVKTYSNPVQKRD